MTTNAIQNAQAARQIHRWVRAKSEAVAPGVVPYSKEWADACATEVEEPLMQPVLAICEEQQLDSKGPNAVAHAINSGLLSSLGVVHVLNSGAEVKPWQLWFDSHGWKYRGSEATGDPDNPEVDRVYGADDIREVRR